MVCFRAASPLCALLAVNAMGAVLRPAPCAFTPPPGARVECAWLDVPECRSQTTTRTLSLHVAHYRAAASKPLDDPIVWLVGGPGGAAHTLSTALFPQVVKPYLVQRDFVVFDPRGVGHSRPPLNCPQPDRACFERLRADGAGIACYNAAEFAADLEDLRLALGARRWNIIGESYGTYLALVAMRRFPQGIRSVVLDSVIPPGFDNRHDDHRWLRNAMRTLVSNCRNDKSCRHAYPDLDNAYDEAARSVARHPLRITGTQHKTPYSFTVDQRTLPLVLFLLFYDSLGPAGVPAALQAISRGDVHPALHHAAFLQAVIPRHLANETVNVLWSCNDSGSLPGFREKCEQTGLRQQLDWPSSPSQIPTLLLAGEYDPATPPEAARAAAHSLPRSQLFILPGYGHMVTAAGPCPIELIESFLANPTRPLTLTCADSLQTQWLLPASKPGK